MHDERAEEDALPRGPLTWRVGIVAMFLCAFAIWWVALIVHVSNLRTTLERSVRSMLAIQDVQQTLAATEPSTLRSQLETIRNGLRDQELTPAVDALDLALTDLDEAPSKRLSAHLVNAVAAIRGRTGAVSQTLGAQWIQLYILGGLSVALAFLAVGLYASTEQRRYRLAQMSSRLARALDEREQARRQAEMALQAKSRFLANMSHEIRPPSTEWWAWSKCWRASGCPVPLASAWISFADPAPPPFNS